MGMSFVTVIESILLHGYSTKRGYLLGIPIGLVAGIIGCIFYFRGNMLYMLSYKG